MLPDCVRRLLYKMRQETLNSHSGGVELAPKLVLILVITCQRNVITQPSSSLLPCLWGRWRQPHVLFIVFISHLSQSQSLLLPLLLLLQLLLVVQSLLLSCFCTACRVECNNNKESRMSFAPVLLVALLAELSHSKVQQQLYQESSIKCHVKAPFKNATTTTPTTMTTISYESSTKLFLPLSYSKPCLQS